MKHLFTSISVFLSVLAFAQIPTQDLIFAHDFNGSFNAAVPENMEPYLNSATLTLDLMGAADRALYVEENQSLRFFNDFVQAGTTNAQLTLSLKVNFDYDFLMNMPDFTYSSVFNSGDCFVRVLKADSYFVQIGLYNGNNFPGSFGYLTIAYQVDPGTLSAWNNISMVYVGNPQTQALVLYYNGQDVLSAAHAATCAQDGNVIYNNFNMIIGGFDENPFQGAVDGIYIHNRALTSEEIWDIHSATSFVGVAQVQKETNLNVFPNPAVNELSIDAPSFGTMEIFDAQGNLVKAATLNPGVNDVDIQALNSGLYFIRFNGISERFMKI